MCIPGILDAAIDMTDGNPELIRVHLRQGRDVIRDLALVEAAAGIIGQAFKQRLEGIRVEWRRHGDLEETEWMGMQSHGTAAHSTQSCGLWRVVIRALDSQPLSAG